MYRSVSRAYRTAERHDGGRYGAPVTEIQEIGEPELPRFVATMRAVSEETDTVEGFLDWRRQARETVWLLATDDGRDVGAAIGIGGWHEPHGVARGELRVRAEARGAGLGSRLLATLSSWAGSLGYAELIGPVKETDEASLAWTGRRGFAEVGRNSRLVLDLTAVDEPAVETPAGIELVTWAERPDLTEGMYTVAREAYSDVPGEEETEIAPFAEWLAMDMQGAGDRPEATFVALAGEEVVAYAKLSLSLARTTVAMHDMTGVRRAWRGRGIASALKAAPGRSERATSGSRRRTRNATSRSGASTSGTATS